MTTLRTFMKTHFLHFNARECVAAAEGFIDHIESGGKMVLSLAGAMSTAELGIILARMIRAGKIHAISCTGANLEEDVFNLIANDRYKVIPNWRGLSAEMEENLYKEGFNRVTDTCIPEDVMHELEDRLIERWRKACQDNERKFPYEYLFDILRSGELKDHYVIDPNRSWMLAAMEMKIPVFSPGWEDSTTGNMFVGAIARGEVSSHQCVKTGSEQFEALLKWYMAHWGLENKRPAPGFFQIGGGIAGDFAICVVPSLIVDMKREDTPFWGYFCQISDAETSYGGYSGAVPNEKITWGKLGVRTPKFMIHSDASIVAPLIFGYILED